MFINNVPKKEDCTLQVLRELTKLGVNARPKKIKQNVKVTGKVFKVPLETLPTEVITLKNGHQVTVPEIVKYLCSLILANVDTEGIFRKECPKSRLTEMKENLENGKKLDTSDSVIDIAVLLKVFLRELPDPLIPWSHHELYFQCISLESNEHQLQAILLACLTLPIEHLNTLCYLLQFLQEVSQQSSKNKMNSHNLAVCLGPTLFPSKPSAKAQTRTLTVNTIVELLIDNALRVGELPDDLVDAMVSSVRRKNKKRRSTSLQRMFNGLKKIVGGKSGEGNHNVVTPDLLLTPVSNTVKNRKTHANGISGRKKKELLSKLPDNVLLSTPFTPCRTPVSMDLSGTHEKHLIDSTDFIKQKKSQWFLRSKSVKNLKNEEVGFKNNGGTKNGLERRWSAISQPSNIKRAKKRNSFAAATLNRKEVPSDINKNETNSPEPNYIRVPKKEYEAIKNRVSAMERRISMELENVQSLIKTENENSTNEEVNSLKNVQTVYEQTLVQTEQLSPTTDQLAKRLSRELKIRRSGDQKIIRSPSARKIGSMRRRSKEFEKSNSRLSRHQSWHAPQKETIPRVSLKRGKPNTVFTGLPANKFHNDILETKDITRTRSSSVGNETIKTISCNLSGSSSDTWVSAEGFFATKMPHSDSSSLSGRASLAKLRSQNAGMVLAKAKLFDQLKDSDSSSSSSLVRSIPKVKVGTKIGSTRNPDSRLSYRVKSLKYEEKRLGKKSMSPRKRNGCLSQKQKLQMARHYLESSTERNSDKENNPEKHNSMDKNVIVPLKDCNRIENYSMLSPKYSTPKMITPHIKKTLNVRSPKRLCRTPLGSERSTPLRVVKTPLYNNV